MISTSNTIRAFIDQAIDEAVAATEKQYAAQFKELEAKIPTGNGAWAAYEPISTLAAQEKGEVARSAFLTGLRYGLAMAHIQNPSLFSSEELGVTK